MNKKTLVIGASLKPERFSNMAIRLLRKKGYEVLALGRNAGKVADVEIQTEPPQDNDIHTVTIYLRPELQNSYYDYILALKPKRVIFNPGTENYEFKEKLENAGIEVVENCTLVMLRSGLF